MAPKHSYAETRRIDNTIRKYYPSHGPDYVATLLNEPRDYIQRRAWYLKIRQNKSNIKEPKKYLSPKDKEILRLRNLNKQLRLELLKQIRKNKLQERGQ